MQFTQEAKLNAETDPNLDWLRDLGVEFDQNTFILTTLSHKIGEKLARWRKVTPKSTIESAIESIKPYLSSSSLLYQWVQIPADSQNSLVQILARDKKFQAPVFDTICNYLTLTAFEANSSEKYKNLVKLIIKSLSFLPQIYQPNLVIESLFDAINNSNENLQPILISQLHEMIESTPAVIQKLLNIMIEKPQMVQDCLTALQSFQLSKEETEKVRKRVLDDILSSATFQDLQSVINFLIVTTDDSNASVTVDAFRQKLVIYNAKSNQNELALPNFAISNESSRYFIIQFKSFALRSTPFFKSYCAALEQPDVELVILDYWALYCMFSTPGQKNKAQTIFIKLCNDNKITPEMTRDSIFGHVRTLDILLDEIANIISWCLSISDTSERNPNSDYMSDIVSAMAQALFEEVDDVCTQQNIVGLLLSQITIGSDVNQLKAARLLSILDPTKLRNHLALISGLLPSYDSLPPSVFTIIISVITKLEFATHAESGSQLHIFVSKMLASNKPEAKQAGIVTGASILNRYFLFGKINDIQTQFNNIMISLDDPYSLSLFFNELANNQKRGDRANEFLVDALSKLFEQIVCEKIKDLNNPIEWFSLDPFISSSLNFISAIDDLNGIQKRSLKRHIPVSSLAFVFSNTGIRLWLDSHLALNHDLKEVFGEFYKMPFKMYDPDNDSLSKDQKIFVLLIVHSFILETLNFFGNLCYEESFERLSNRTHIEELLLNLLSEYKSYNHPYLGQIFSKCNNVLKKITQTTDRSAHFIYQFRYLFPAPRLQYLNLLFNLNLPLSEAHIPICTRLLDDYLYLISPKRLSNNNSLFTCEQLTNPPLDIITFISNKLLDSVILEDNPECYVKYQEVIERIFNIVNTQIKLPVYSEKKEFNSLLRAICDKENQLIAFNYFLSKLSATMKDETYVTLVELLKNILHCGPPTRNAVDLYGKEMKHLRKACKNFLRTKKANKAYVHRILVIFFDRNPKGQNDLQEIIEILTMDILNGQTNPQWISLTSETFLLYYEQCWKFINSKISEISKKLKTNQFDVLNEQNVLALLDLIKNLGLLAKKLIQNISNNDVTSAILAKVIPYGSSWMENCTQLLDFLKDACQVSKEDTVAFISTNRCIRRNLQALIDHVRKNFPNSEKSLPRLTKAVESWSYNLKNSFQDVYDGEALIMEKMPDRDIEGNRIKETE